MNNMKDGLKVCPHCGSSLCYEQEIGNDKTWMCLGCGYTSTSLMKEGSKEEQELTHKQPNLYKELRFVDSEKYVWYPAVVTVPEKGILYADIVDTDWQWAMTPMRELTSKEQQMKKYRGLKYVADMQQTKHFDKLNFIEAAKAIGMLDEN